MRCPSGRVLGIRVGSRFEQHAHQLPVAMHAGHDQCAPTETVRLVDSRARRDEAHADVQMALRRRQCDRQVSRRITGVRIGTRLEQPRDERVHSGSRRDQQCRASGGVASIDVGALRDRIGGGCLFAESRRPQQSRVEIFDAAQSRGRCRRRPRVVDALQRLDRALVTLLGGHPIPANGFGAVGRRTPAVLKHRGKLVLRLRVARSGGTPKALVSRSVILLHASASALETGEVVPGTRVSPLGHRRPDGRRVGVSPLLHRSQRLLVSRRSLRQHRRRQQPDRRPDSERSHHWSITSP